MGTSNHSVIVASADILIRSGLVAVIQHRLGVTDVQEANDAGDCLNQLRKTPAGTIIIDRGLVGDMHSLRNMRAATKGLQLALLVNTIDRTGMTQLLEAGVNAIIPKRLPQEELVRALKSVLRGKGYLPASGEASHRQPNASNDHDSVFPLTTRQYQVMRLAMSGKSNKEIAHILGISESTVKIHMSSAFRALGTRNRMGAFARLNDLETPPDPGRPEAQVLRIERRKGERRQGDRRQQAAVATLVPRRRS